MNAVAAPPFSPYRGLAPFGDSDLDALLFFGREREREVIVANLIASRLTVLYGPSGVGKTSILRAGAARRLREVAPGAEVVVLDRWTGPVQLPRPEGEAYLILDQLEEYFLYHGAAGPLADELSDLLGRPGPSVLLAIREDALAKLDAFQTRIPAVFANRVRLDELDAAAARDAIVRPLERWNELVADEERVEAEAALVAAVVSQATVPRPGGGACVEPPYLQLVLERIWDEELASGSSVLRLATLERLGGAQTIVREHLERSLRGLPPRDADLAASALKFLVTPSRTKIAHTVTDLAGYTAAGPAELRAVLDALSAQRILRTVAPSDGEGTRYEIFHDVLAEPVLAWRQEVEARAAVERERRRHRRLLVFAGAALALAAAMAALALFALAQRHDARHQASLARAGRVEALRQARRAERSGAAAAAAAVAAKRLQRLADASAARARQNEGRARASERAALREQSRAQQQQALAEQQKALAQQQKALAQEQEARAEAASRRAEANAAEAERQARLSTVAADVARSDAELAVDPVGSVRAALAAAALEPSPRVEDALRSSLVALRVRGVLDGGGGGVNEAVFSPDGSLVATGTAGGDVRVFSTSSHRPLRALSTSSQDLERSVALGAPVVALAFDAEGRRLLAATSAGAVSLRDVRSGAVLAAFRAPRLRSAAFAAGGTVVTGSGDGTLAIWSAADGQLLRRVETRLAVASVAVSPNGRLAALFDPNKPTVDVVDLASGAVVASLQEQGNVTSAAFSPDGALLATGGHRNAYVWNTGDWSLRHLLVGHEYTISALAFSRGGLLVTASEDSSARVWDPATGELVFILASQHQQKLLAAAFGPQGTLATASADRTARIWPASFGIAPIVLAGHTDSVTGVSFSPDGRLVLTWSADGTARLWSATVPALSEVGAEEGAIAAASFSPDGKLVVAGGADGTARIWRAGGGAVATLRQDGEVTAASFVDRGARVLTAGEDGTARLWTATGSPVRTFGHGAPVRAALAEPDGAVVTAGDDGIVRFWGSSGRLLWASADHAPVAVAAVAPVGTVATGAADGTVRLRRAADGTRLRLLRNGTRAVTSLAFSADGSLLAAAGADGKVRLWDVTAGRLVHVLRSGAAVTSAVFSPDGTLVLTSDTAGNVRTWSAETGRVVHDLRFHVAVVGRAAFSADGRWIVTAGPSTAGIWQTRTGKLLYALGNSGGPLTTAAFSPSGWTILTGGRDGRVRTFACTVCAEIPALESLARQRLAALSAGS